MQTPILRHERINCERQSVECGEIWCRCAQSVLTVERVDLLVRVPSLQHGYWFTGLVCRATTHPLTRRHLVLGTRVSHGFVNRIVHMLRDVAVLRFHIKLAAAGHRWSSHFYVKDSILIPAPPNAYQLQKKQQISACFTLSFLLYFF